MVSVVGLSEVFDADVVACSNRCYYGQFDLGGGLEQWFTTCEDLYCFTSHCLGVQPSLALQSCLKEYLCGLNRECG